MIVKFLMTAEVTIEAHELAALGPGADAEALARLKLDAYRERASDGGEGHGGVCLYISHRPDVASGHDWRALAQRLTDTLEEVCSYDSDMNTDDPVEQADALIEEARAALAGAP